MKQLLSPSHISRDNSSIVDMDYFVRTLTDIHAKGLRPDLIGSIITHYASMWLPDLFAQSSEKLATSPSKIRFRPYGEHDSPESSGARWTRKKMCVEALAVMLPPEKGSVTCDFLLRLLRVGSMVGAESACQAELERRVMWQLEQASLKELMIPSFSHTCGTLLDVGLVLRLVKGFVKLDGAVPIRSGAALAKVAKLVDCYLAEVAIDSNLSSSEFLALAGALPSHARSTDDGLYRAIDTYFKAHPGVSKQERKSMCRLIDSQKLSPEAGLHAIQNDRLPVRDVIRIIFSEQAKLHSRLNWRCNSLNANQGPTQSVRCHSKREITQQMEIKKLREDVVRLEKKCATMQVHIEKMMEKKGYYKWKKIGMAALRSVGGGGERIEVKERTPNKWRKSVS